jgi:hypothetical protein
MTHATTPASAESGIAVLMLVFNRPSLTLEVFEAVRQQKPARLYIAADGPRSGRDDDARLCAETRDIVAHVDWPCTVSRLFRSENLGCKRAVSEAISWFFSHEPEGVILEDDCVPSADFFRFAKEMLHRFREDKSVFAVQGNCFTTQVGEYDYYFSRNFFMWGWATWADRWRQVRMDSGFLLDMVKSNPFREWPSRQWLVRSYWNDILRRQIAGEFDSWGYPTTFNMFYRRQYNVTPTANLVRNIGFGPSATHSAGVDVGPLNEGFGHLRQLLVHCAAHRSPEAAFRDENRWRIRIGYWPRLRSWLEQRLPAQSLLRRSVAAMRHGFKG